MFEYGRAFEGLDVPIEITVNSCQLACMKAIQGAQLARCRTQLSLHQRGVFLAFEQCITGVGAGPQAQPVEPLQLPEDVLALAVCGEQGRVAGKDVLHTRVKSEIHDVRLEMFRQGLRLALHFPPARRDRAERPAHLQHSQGAPEARLLRLRAKQGDGRRRCRALVHCVDQ